MVEKLRTVLPFTVGIRDGAVQMVSTLGSVVISAWAGVGDPVGDTVGRGYGLRAAAERRGYPRG